MGHRLEIVKNPRRRNWVVVVKGTVDDLAIDRMDDWCCDQGVGQRISYDRFQFATKEDAVVFFLNWTS